MNLVGYTVVTEKYSEEAIHALHLAYSKHTASDTNLPILKVLLLSFFFFIFSRFRISRFAFFYILPLCLLLLFADSGDTGRR